MTNELVEKLKPKHLPDSMEELKEQIEEPKKPVDDDSPKLKNKYPFHFKWTDGRGKVWEGDFVNTIPSIGERPKIGLLRAALCNNMPLESLDSFTIELTVKLAHMEYSLTEKPEWAKNMLDLHDYELIDAIYEEVASHEATFFGRK